jgi:CRP-like cAMP-binding protein
MNLTSCDLFEGLSEIQNQCLAALVEVVTVPKGEWLFREGAPADQLYCVKQGAAELLTRIDDHIELPITILRPGGGLFGTSSLVAPYIYSLSARSFEESHLLIIKQHSLMEQIKQDPEMGFIIMSNLAKTFLDRLKETRQEVKIHFKTLFKIMRY